jgi:SAM-dependent methyltransferase
MSPIMSADPDLTLPSGDRRQPLRRFLSELTSRQLLAWLPGDRTTVLDLSVGVPWLHDAMKSAGHVVLSGDCRALDWVRDGVADAVVAEGGALSHALATEVAVEELHRVLKPRGRLLLGVHSLVSGLSSLADQGRWAELADVPAADVVLVDKPDGSVTRCFWPEELHAILTGAGFEVEWMRPRMVLAPDAVSRALADDPDKLEQLISTELELEEQRAGESCGAQLIASAIRN